VGDEETATLVQQHLRLLQVTGRGFCQQEPEVEPEVVAFGAVLDMEWSFQVGLVQPGQGDGLLLWPRVE